MPRERLVSVHNPRIKAAIKLRERAVRRTEGLMSVEGFHETALAWRSGLQVQTLYFCPELVRAEEESLLSAMEDRGVQIAEVSPEVMERLAYRENPDAWFAVAKQPETRLDGLDARIEGLRSSRSDQSRNDALLVVVAEGIEKPGNLGAILRSADACGADALIVTEGRTDVCNPNVVRASKGTLFSIPVAESSNEEALAWIQDRGVTVTAASPEKGILYWDADMRGPLAILVGAEKEGLSEFWLGRSAALPDSDGVRSAGPRPEGQPAGGRDPIVRVSLPMRGMADSLNVAQTATLILYEALRQRGAGRNGG